MPTTPSPEAERRLAHCSTLYDALIGTMRQLADAPIKCITDDERMSWINLMNECVDACDQIDNLYDGITPDGDLVVTEAEFEAVLESATGTVDHLSNTVQQFRNKVIN